MCAHVRSPGPELGPPHPPPKIAPTIRRMGTDPPLRELAPTSGRPSGPAIPPPPRRRRPTASWRRLVGADDEAVSRLCEEPRGDVGAEEDEARAAGVRRHPQPILGRRAPARGIVESAPHKAPHKATAYASHGPSSTMELSRYFRHKASDPQGDKHWRHMARLMDRQTNK